MSRKEAERALKRQLGTKPPAGLAALSGDELDDLARAVRDARHRQAAELQAAGEKAFGHISRLLRGPIRKVMGASSSVLRSRAEVIKLARLLRREPEQLEYLELVPPEDIRLLREQVTDMLFEAHDATLRRLAASSKLLPVGLVATLGQHAFGAMLSARIAGLLTLRRAVEIAAKMPPEFLADVAIELDPRRASEVIAGIPADQIEPVTRELVDRGEFVTMGRSLVTSARTRCGFRSRPSTTRRCCERRSCSRSATGSTRSPRWSARIGSPGWPKSPSATGCGLRRSTC